MTQTHYPDIRLWLEHQTPAMIDDIFLLMRIPSVSGPSSGSYPYGTNCAQALDTIVTLVQRLGFPVTNYDYHCATVLLPGKTTEEIGIFTHIDIVPEGSGWSNDPYSPYIKDGHIFGRGSTDNKGPAVAALYLLAALRDSGQQLDHSIRLYFGCDEESGMRDITHYLSVATPPKLALIPDARYSVCHGEKGILELTLALDIAGSNLVDFAGGLAANMVPDHAELSLGGTDAATCLARLPEHHGCTVVTKDGHVTIATTGVAAHAAFPETGVSAIARLAAAVSGTGLADDKGDAALAILSQTFADCHGAGMQLACEDMSGKLTHIGGVLSCTDGVLYQTVNIRYPVTANGSELLNIIRSWCMDKGWTLQDYKDNPPSFTDVTHPVVQLLNDIASEELEQPFKPYTMGGGTYARKFPFGFAFGPLLRELPRPGGGGHQPDECVSIQGLCRFIEIYLRALYELDCTI